MRLVSLVAPAALLAAAACAPARPAAPPATAAAPSAAHAPVDAALYRAIAQQDSLLFVAFNRHDLDAMQPYFAEDLEFFHDKGGLSNFAQTMQGFRRLFEQNRSTGLRRVLVPGTLEVYPIKGYGAVETYQHRFCHQENGKDDCGTFKNLMVWRLQNGRWQITRVVSYDH
ncbi:nuclear transport factor 2 family protein [Hymenobacter sp. 15J16-1T3B]|uniref:nuclear transport factor 2 family protein n=1 Tax=Hymenobacter sp. 15J16-1T3B TaxID=2886941 RepID=UPI001D0FEE28|nr:nuclear transport factor 2 family protein [Hymenobacter sp. 15J16-1T3B]MCC3158246.1 nuclear transport factor 2 family protein [Hymenobacter sp. 15J16-1T3B]